MHAGEEQGELEEDLDEEIEAEVGEGEARAGEGRALTGAAAPSGQPAAPKPPRAPVGAAAGVHTQGGHPMADLNAARLAPRRPDRVQYTAPSETGEATVVGGGANEFAGVGRNAMCPCGSGKKYKRCHGDPRLQN